MKRPILHPVFDLCHLCQIHSNFFVYIILLVIFFRSFFFQFFNSKRKRATYCWDVWIWKLEFRGYIIFYRAGEEGGAGGRGQRSGRHQGRPSESRQEERYGYDRVGYGSYWKIDITPLASGECELTTNRVCFSNLWTEGILEMNIL